MAEDLERIRFGLFLPQMRMSYPTILERVFTAEDAGFDSVWFMDHLAPPTLEDADSFEAWTVATAVATATRRIRVGHMVLCDAFRHPALLAKMASSLDVITGGRFDLGIGWGSTQAELVRFGFQGGPPTRRAARLRETLEIVRLLWSGEVVDYAGNHFSIEGAQQRPTPVLGSVPIHIGGAGPLSLALARTHGDWWNCPTTATDRFGEISATLEPPLRSSVQHVVGLASSERERDEVSDTTTRRFKAWGSGVLSGTADEIAATLTDEVRAGASGFVLAFSDFGAAGMMERFMREVAPAVEAASAAASVRTGEPRAT